MRPSHGDVKARVVICVECMHCYASTKNKLLNKCTSLLTIKVDLLP